jgi:hypothetical protein
MGRAALGTGDWESMEVNMKNLAERAADICEACKREIEIETMSTPSKK